MLSVMILLGNRDWGSLCLVNKADSVCSSCDQSGYRKDLVNSEETIYRPPPRFHFQSLIVQTNFDQLLSKTNCTFSIQVNCSDNFKALKKKTSVKFIKLKQRLRIKKIFGLHSTDTT